MNKEKRKVHKCLYPHLNIKIDITYVCLIVVIIVHVRFYLIKIFIYYRYVKTCGGTNNESLDKN